MDIKLKKDRKSKPIRVWIASFIGINIFIISIFGAFVFTYSINLYIFGISKNDINAAMSGDMYESDLYKQQMLRYVVFLNEYINGKNELSDELIYSEIANRNIVVYAKNSSTGKEYKSNNMNNAVDLPDQYQKGLYYDGIEFYLVDGKNRLPLKDPENNYLHLINQHSYINEYSTKRNDSVILLAINYNLNNYDGAYSQLYNINKFLSTIRAFLFIAFATILIGILLVIYSIIRRKDKKILNQKISLIFRKILFEIKIACFFINVLFLVSMYELWGVIASIFSLILLIWNVYFTAIDLKYNKFQYFKNNIINNVINYVKRRIQKLELNRRYKKALFHRFIGLLVSEALMIFCLILIMFQSDFSLFIVFLMIMAISIGVLASYIKKYSNDLSDISQIFDHIDAMKNGYLDHKVYLSKTSLLKPTVENLDSIQSGVNRAAEEYLKSERMKIELITNVSHDLKTPLTSIINYVDLLSKEDLPEYVNDYIKVLQQKSSRLKNLIQDIFDLSKATSNSIEVDFQRLDLVKLIRQVSASLDENIKESNLKFVYKLPDEPVYITSDGTKLHRVIENLYTNSIKYSLENSRVYVSISFNPDNSCAIIEIKNTSKAEIDFTEDEIIGRFVRGDKNRTTEGSGLGLAIAKNFTEICGGIFKVDLDGDLFKASLKFKIEGEETSLTQVGMSLI